MHRLEVPMPNALPFAVPRLVMTMQGYQAMFDFVLNVPQNPGPGGSWAVGAAYSPGARVTYGGREYVCLQGHTAQPGWEPPAAPALWRTA